MLDVRLAESVRGADSALALVVRADTGPADGDELDEAGVAEVAAYLADLQRPDAGGTPGAAGTVNVLPRPDRTPRRLYLTGIGDGGAAAWRSAGAALVRQACREASLGVVLPAEVSAEAVRALAEGLLLAAYRYRLAADDDQPALTSVVLATRTPGLDAALAEARSVATGVLLARDLTNTPSNRKNPAWFVDQVTAAVDAEPVEHLTLDVWGPGRLAAEGFGGVLAVGRGSRSEPRLLQLRWEPPGAGTSVVLVGKGITFDTGGISIKPADGMRLMRKDMGGAAAVVAATLTAAALRLPVRVTALAPLAENAVDGDAFRPGDVVRHASGLTSEITNTDAEGRLVLADALGYAAATLRPDYLVDLATLTGAQQIALGKRTAALFSENDALAAALTDAAARAGESMWRLPLVDDYADQLRSDVADLANAGEGGAGCVTAALFLREFTGSARAGWAHLDMSAPAWSDKAADELAKGATGWGVRTLVCWLSSLAPDPAA